MVRPRLVVLIPESTRKAKGGESAGSPTDSFPALLPRDTRARLEALRSGIGSSASATVRDPSGFLPAYLRFQGNMYRRIPREAWEGRAEGVEVVIVSGLYGLLLSREPAVAYGCSMAEELPPMGKLNRWWHDRGLPGILADGLVRLDPRRVVDLLSLEYREAVSGYAAGLGRIPVTTIDFRGLGRGSQPRRGRVVAEILQTGRIPRKTDS